MRELLNFACRVQEILPGAKGLQVQQDIVLSEIRETVLPHKVHPFPEELVPDGYRHLPNFSEKPFKAALSQLSAWNTLASSNGQLYPLTRCRRRG